MSKKILILGEGFLGTKLNSKLIEAGFNSLAVSPSHLKYKVDITIPTQLKTIFNSFKPDIVVLVAAITDVDFCEKNKDLASKINIEGVKNVVEACKSLGCKLIFISTDSVFDGKKGNYFESDQVNPINHYSLTKVEGEKLVSTLSDYLILRVAALYGFNHLVNRKTFVNWIIDSLKNGKKIDIVTDQMMCPTLIDDIGNAIISLVNQNEKGLFHCSGSEAVSKYDFAQKIAKVFDLDSSLIQETTSAILKQTALRPHNISLNISKLESKGIKMHGCLQGLKIMKKQMNELIELNK